MRYFFFISRTVLSRGTYFQFFRPGILYPLHGMRITGLTKILGPCLYIIRIRLYHAVIKPGDTDR
jgi:hypothetical protein